MNENKHPLQDFMETSIGKIRELADSNAIVGQPITTPDGVTLIPISRVNFGFSSGGTDYGKTAPTKFAGGSSAANSSAKNRFKPASPRIPVYALRAPLFPFSSLHSPPPGP